MKKSNLGSDSKPSHKHIVEKNVIQLTHCICKIVLKCQKTTKKVAKKPSMVEPPSTKMLLSHS